MAFNFNWSPLIADTSRARDMLTTALNKSPKPPIIVDDIIVNELNLGSVPPELEILEIGDLAEDRFRGIFRMSYSGDAFLTLRTRVQANPLNTYLSTRPSFASPQPLAASSGLTIPLQITLSDIRLSGFVVLVFSRQKGITLVFRNDPLESLKVSSTFDSIPFVRDYLQKEIEGQLRVLFMEDLPAIIHRLSLRLFVPEYQTAEQAETAGNSTARVDPLSSSTSDPVDPFQNSPFASDSSSTETYASFSQKNLLRLATLTESQRTLSLFTPSIRDTVFRAWAGSAERLENTGIASPQLAGSVFSRAHSHTGSMASTQTLSQGFDGISISSRPSLTSLATMHPPSSAPGSYYGGRSRAHPSRKRKTRVVNLRRTAGADGGNTSSADVSADVSDAASVSTETSSNAAESSTGAPSWPLSDPAATIVERSGEREGELQTPPQSPRKGVKFRAGEGVGVGVGGESSVSVGEERGRAEGLRNAPPTTPRKKQQQQPGTGAIDADATPVAAAPARTLSAPPGDEHDFAAGISHTVRPSPARSRRQPTQKELPSWLTSRQPMASNDFLQSSTGGILEQAWMMKMATEIARKVQEEKSKHGGSPWRRGDSEDGEAPPPAYSN
ncbi:MAG: ERMES complex subunit [Bathelium mastoideum]|nr:MAG: ERMES complex subunit [Bathelium mastoideum]